MITTDSLSTTVRDALTAAATGTLTVSIPLTTAGAINYAYMAKMTITVNGVKLVEGTDFTAGTSVNATAEDIEDAINTNSSATLCTAVATDAVILITASANGPDGNLISVGSTRPEAVYPSGPTLSGGSLPVVGDIIFNSTTGTYQVYTAGAVWMDLAPGIPVLAADPSSPAEGAVWYNTTSHLLKYQDNSGTKTVATV